MKLKKYYSQKYLKILGFFILLTLIGAWIAAVYFLGINYVVEQIGTRNIYLLTFLAALLGGSSSFSSASFFTFFITLSASQANPLIMSIVGGLGLSIGDSLFYYLGSQGRKIKSKFWLNKMKKLSHWIKKQKLWLVYLIIFIYNALTPFPGDILNIVLGLSAIKYRKIIPIIIIGNISLLYIISYFLNKSEFIVNLLS